MPPVGEDIEVLLPLRITEALLGTTKEIETPKGAKKIKIPPHVKPGTKIRLKGLGFPILGRQTAVGNFYIKIEYTIPKQITGEQKKAIEHLQQIGL